MAFEVGEHRDDVLFDHGRRRSIALGELGDDRPQIALAVAELKHRGGGIVDLEDTLGRDKIQRPRPSSCLSLKPRGRRGRARDEIVHPVMLGRNAPGGIRRRHRRGAARRAAPTRRWS